MFLELDKVKERGGERNDGVKLNWNLMRKVKK